LSSAHNESATTPNLSIEQATVNLLADMYAQPQTLIAGLVRASATTDLTPPASTIAAPSNGASFKVGSTVTISGTATDSGGGVVAGVEVSFDGGVTWHPAVTSSAGSTVTWSYIWTVTTPGPIVLKSRATDDSANIETPSAGVNVSATYQAT